MWSRSLLVESVGRRKAEHRAFERGVEGGARKNALIERHQDIGVDLQPAAPGIDQHRRVGRAQPHPQPGGFEDDVLIRRAVCGRLGRRGASGETEPVRRLSGRRRRQ